MKPTKSRRLMERLVRRLLLFLRLAWREWEPPGRIPDEYRVHHRITLREAWKIASDVWSPNAVRSATPEKQP
jgi:hypothetical protein